MCSVPGFVAIITCIMIHVKLRPCKLVVTAYWLYFTVYMNNVTIFSMHIIYYIYAEVHTCADSASSRETTNKLPYSSTAVYISSDSTELGK